MPTKTKTKSTKKPSPRSPLTGKSARRAQIIASSKRFHINRRAKVFVAATAVLVLVSGGLAWYYFSQQNQADAATTKPCTSVTFGRYKNNPTYSQYKMYKPCVQAIQSKVGAGSDGIYGDYTQKRVKAWQSNHGLSPDGVVGPKTWAKMKINPRYTVAKKASENSARGWKTTIDNKYIKVAICRTDKGTKMRLTRVDNSNTNWELVRVGEYVFNNPSSGSTYTKSMNVSDINSARPTLNASVYKYSGGAINAGQFSYSPSLIRCP